MQRRLRYALPWAFLASLLLALLLPGQSTPTTKVASNCSNLLVIGVRGSGEAYDSATAGMGGVNYAAYQQIKSRVPGTQAYGLPYEAVAIKPTQASNYTDIVTRRYWSSIDLGKIMLGRYVDQVIASCPAQRIVLLGYSQGAHVIGDLMPLWEGNATVRSHIGGILLFGDPMFGPNSSVNRGTFSTSRKGIWPSFKIGSVRNIPATWASNTRSYCDGQDFICNFSTSNYKKCGDGSSCGHFGYVNSWTAASAGTWLGNLIKALPSLAPVQQSPTLPATGGSGGSATSTPGGVRVTNGYIVSGTCADNGCGLRVRSGPGYSNYAWIGSLKDGDPISIVCQTAGQRVSNGRYFSDVWNKIVWGSGFAWISDFYTNTPGVNQYLAGVPRC